MLSAQQRASEQLEHVQHTVVRVICRYLATVNLSAKHVCKCAPLPLLCRSLLTVGDLLQHRVMTWRRLSAILLACTTWQHESTTHQHNGQSTIGQSAGCSQRVCYVEAALRCRALFLQVVLVPAQQA
jgi:hypothetical protein